MNTLSSTNIPVLTGDAALLSFHSLISVNVLRAQLISEEKTSESSNNKHLNRIDTTELSDSVHRCLNHKRPPASSGRIGS